MAAIDCPLPELQSAARALILRALRGSKTIAELAEELQVSERTAKRIRARFRVSSGPRAVLLEND